MPLHPVDTHRNIHHHQHRCAASTATGKPVGVCPKLCHTPARARAFSAFSTTSNVCDDTMSLLNVNTPHSLFAAYNTK